MEMRIAIKPARATWGGGQNTVYFVKVISRFAHKSNVCPGTIHKPALIPYVINSRPTNKSMPKQSSGIVESLKERTQGNLSFEYRTIFSNAAQFKLGSYRTFETCTSSISHFQPVVNFSGVRCGWKGRHGLFNFRNFPVVMHRGKTWVIWPLKQTRSQLHLFHGIETLGSRL